MTIVHVIFNIYAPGGAETMVIDIANRQAALGHDVALVLINSGNDDALLSTLRPEVKVRCAQRPEGSRNPLYALRLNRLLWGLKPDIIHLHGEKAIGMIVRPLGSKALLTLHTTGLHVSMPGRLNAVCAISQGVAGELYDRQKLSSEVIYNGIRVADVRQRPLRALKPGEPIRLVQVSRLDHTVKGQHLLLRAMVHLREQGYDNLHLTFIGDGPSRQLLTEMVRQHDLDNRVEFKGALSRKEIYDTLADYDIAIQPSLTEGFGLTIAEAMAARLPVIVADLPGPLEVIGGGRYGTTFHTGNSTSLSRAIEQTVQHYESAQQSAVEESFHFVQSNFDINATTDRYLDLYERL